MSFITIPFAKLLLLFYNLTSNYGLAIILFAVVVKLIMLPFQMKSKKGMARMSRLTPRMQELEKKYGSNKERYQQEVAKLYQEAKVNPMSGCIWTLIPFPILIALYSVIRQPLSRMLMLAESEIATITEALSEWGLYTVGSSDAYVELEIANLIHENFAAVKDLVPSVVDIDFSFLGMNMSNIPKWNFFSTVDWTKKEVWLPAVGLFLIPIISALLSYLSMKISQKDTPQTTEQSGTMGTMLFMMPIISLIICFTMPAALGVYWIANSVLAIAQDLLLNKRFQKQMDIEDAEWRERERLREEELERKRAETERLKAEGKTVQNRNTSKRKLQAAEKNRKDELAAAELRAERAARRKALGIEEEEIPESQVGKRRFARGRAYVSDRYTHPETAAAATAAAAAASAANDSPIVEDDEDLANVAEIAEEVEAEELFESDAEAEEVDEDNE